jgi:ERCC4-type nuclease
MKPKLQPITIIQDTREQRPLDFSPFPNVTVEVAKLWPGDYSVKGYEKSIAFERKSVADLIGTLKNGYAGRHALRRLRFDYELEEFERHFDRAFIIVEPDEMATIHEAANMKHLMPQMPTYQPSAAEQIDRALYRSIIEPRMIWAFLRALTVEYGCHVYLAANREDAAAEVVEIARKYVISRRQVVHRDATPSAKSSTQLPPWD